MDKKIKLLVIGLGALAAISLLIAFQLNLTNNKVRQQNSALQQELSRINQENSQLSARLSTAMESGRALSASLADMETKDTEFQAEIKRLQERLELANKERDNLVTKIEGLISDKQKLQDELDKKATARQQEPRITEAAPLISTVTTAEQAHWAEVLRQKVDAELELENVKSQVREITYRADALMKERDALQMEVSAIRQERDDLARRVDYNAKLAKALSEDLVREKDDKETVLVQIDVMRQDNQMLRARVQDLDNTKTTLYKKIDSLEEQRSNLQQKLQEAEHILSERINEVVKIKSDIDRARSEEVSAGSNSRTVELSPIIVRGEQDTTEPLVTGRVVSLNEKNNFVIVDIGERSGVKLGSTFGVYRNDSYIATVEIIQLRGEVAAADIRSITPGNTIKAGDIVKLISTS